MKRFAIMKRAYVWVSGGIILMIAAWFFFLMNFQLSIEFTGGVEIQIPQVEDTTVLQEDLQQTLITKEYPDANVYVHNEGTATALLITLGMGDDEDVKNISSVITDTLISKEYIAEESAILSQSLNGPSISAYMKSTAIIAVILGILFVVIYMLFSFASIREVIPPAKLTLVTILTMVFDMSIPAGAYGIMTMINPTMQVDSIFIIALLTIIGYSINDTIIVMDRIRENATKVMESLKKGGTLYGNVFENSVWQTMRRSIATSLSTFIVVLAMYILGTDVIRRFAFTMGIGVICGTFSSVFIAAPSVYILLGKFNKEAKKLK